MDSGLKKTSKRMKWLDMARGIAIILVMTGHCIGKETFLYHFSFTFHVPVFFVISGYLYKYKKDSYKKDFLQLAIPYAVVVLLVLISTKIIGPGSYYGSMRNVIKSALFGAGAKHKDIMLMGGIWFFPTLFIARRYMDFIFVTAKKEWQRARLAGAFVIFGVGLAKEKIWLPMNADVAMVCVIFMYAGYLLKEKQFRMNGETFFVAACMWLASLCCENINIGKRDYELWYITFAGAIAASILIMELCKKMENVKLLTPFNGFLAFTGRHTLFLLCVHDLDWRMPFQVWGASVGARFSGMFSPTLIFIIRRLSFDFFILFCGLLLFGAVKSLGNVIRRKRNTEFGTKLCGEKKKGNAD